MRKFIALFAVFMSFSAAPAPAGAASLGQKPPNAQVLILYDAHPGDSFGTLGGTYAIMLKSLLGHFRLEADIVPVESYTAGKVEQYQTAFYFGSYYDNPVPAAFLVDMKRTSKTVVWFKYNLWKIAWDPAFDFAGNFGFKFKDLRGMTGAPSSENPNPGFFDTIQYKNLDMKKFYDFSPGTGVMRADPDVGLTEITDSSKAQVLVKMKNSQSGEEAPYIVRSGNFWYFADIPLTYIGPRDRYLVLCDILHDILKIDHPEQHLALVRLEDVGATVDPVAMRTLTDYLAGKKIPFSIATIPFYRDPLGKYSNGVPHEVHLWDSEASGLRQSLRYALKRGGSLVMHGYTHQYNSMKNLHTGASADDFEFWNAVENRPVDEDSEAWTLGRLDAGTRELSVASFSAFAWEPPHYQASPVAYRAFTKRFATTYQRVVYYTSDKPNLDPTSTNRDFSAGMFFPYMIWKDAYGQKIIPENLGNIEYDIHDLDPTSNFNYTSQDLFINAQYALAVRDGYASFFFHPFWLESELGLPGDQDFQNLVEGITALGFKWTNPKNL